MVATTSVVPWMGRPHVLASLIDVTQLKSAEDQIGRSQVRIFALAARLMQLQEEERARLSRDLHDQLGQRLSALKIILDRLDRHGDHPELTGVGAEIAQELIEMVREMSFELRPAMLDELGLPAAIRHYVERSAEASGLDVTIDVEESLPSLSDAGSTACFRILQEAVTNVLRHAEAETVEVGLHREGDVTVLEVRDDGRGFDREATEHMMGVLIMEERAESVGGRVRITSEVDGGTEVVARLPAGSETRRLRGRSA